MTRRHGLRQAPLRLACLEVGTEVPQHILPSDLGSRNPKSTILTFKENYLHRPSPLGARRSLFKSFLLPLLCSVWHVASPQPPAEEQPVNGA